MSSRPPPPPDPSARTPGGGAFRPPPSRAWYVLAGVILLASIVAPGFAAYGAVRAAEVMPERFLAPGSATVEAAQGVTYTVFLHHEGSAAGDVPPGEVPARALDCEVRDAATGAALPLRRRETVSLTVLEQEFASRFAFTAARDTTYELTCEHASEPERVVPLAVGRAGALPRAIAAVAVAAVVGFGGVLTGVLVAVVVALRRRRA